jgi:hypothetical protein
MLTDAQGRFRFERVPAGEYRLQVERVGHQRVVSPVVRVEAGATLRHDIRAAVQPVQLAEITVGRTRCLTAGQLGQDSAVASIWNEARKGLETRRAFALQYRFTRVMRQEVALKPRIGKTNRELKEDTIVSEPDSVRVREQRRRASRGTDGYGRQGRTTFSLSLPNETELLDDEFLREHCLEASVNRAEGVVALRFRPLRPRGDRIDIRGTLWMDAETHLIRRLDLDWLDGNRSIAQGSVEYADTPIGGSTLRLPSRGGATGRPGGVIGVAIARMTSDFTYAYRDVQQVRSR